MSSLILPGDTERERQTYKDAKSIYDDVTAPRNDKHGGYIAFDGKVACQTKQCAHCGCHWPVRKDSGIIRGKCLKCMQDTCGALSCDPCVNFIKRIERQWEAQNGGRPLCKEEVDRWLAVGGV